MGEEAEAAIRMKNNSRSPPLLTLGDNKIENWKRFKQRWNNYCLLSDVSKADRTLQVARLENSFDDDTLKLLDGFHFATPADERTTAEILEAFDRHVIGITNDTQERYILAVASKKLSLQ